MCTYVHARIYICKTMTMFLCVNHKQIKITFMSRDNASIFKHMCYCSPVFEHKENPCFVFIFHKGIY